MFILEKGNKPHPFIQDYHFSNMEIINIFKEVFEKDLPPQIENKNNNNIPKIIHQIYLGEELNNKQKKLQETWIKKHPNWEYILWTKENIKNLKLCNQKTFDLAINDDTKLDILKYEILHKFGGLYVDINFECIKPFDILHESYDFYCGTLPIKLGIGLTNSIIAAKPNHPILQRCVKNIETHIKKTNTINKKDHIEEFFRLSRDLGIYYFTKQFLYFFMKEKTTTFYENIIILPTTYFSSNYHNITKESFSINHKKYNKSSAVTYMLWGSRLGDKLLGYAKAKWISYIYDIPLFYRPFPYSDKMAMHEIEQYYDDTIKKNYRSTFFTHRRNQNFTIDKNASCIYIIDYFYPTENIEINWNDKNFIQELRKTISPCFQINIPPIPKDRISVAMHVRKGGGFDRPLLSEKNNNLPPNQREKFSKQYIDCLFPSKFPPNNYYTKQIKHLYNLLNNTPLHIHIFTDDKNPTSILEKYKNKLHSLDITFSCREKENGPNNNVLDDFFAMTKYDCLIRTDSLFSIFTEILGDFFITISPQVAYWKENYLEISNVDLKINMQQFNKVAKFINKYDFEENIISKTEEKGIQLHYQP